MKFHHTEGFTHLKSAPTDLQVTKTHPEQSDFLGH